MPTAPARPLRWIVAGLAVAVAALFLGQHLLRDHLVARDRDQRDVLVQQAIGEISRTLPRPFDENLVAERVVFENDTLVVVIRSTTRSADATSGDAAGLEAVRLAEQERLRDVCQDPVAVRLLASGLHFGRRFVDDRGLVFFQVSLSAADCAAAPPSPFAPGSSA